MNIINIISKLPRKGTQDSPHAIGAITKIIVHHDAQFRPEAYDDLTRYTQQANYHISRGEDGLQYHYKVSNMGDVYQCRNLTDTLWHCSNYTINRASIAICLDGNMESQQPTQAQLVALQALLTNLSTQHPEFPADQNDVFYHNEVALPGSGTACCGKNLKPYVVKFRQTGQMLVSTPVPVPPAPTPTVPQVPVTTKYYRVFDYNGTQIGAYTTLVNAQAKLDSIEAGTIKDPDMKVIATKEKKPPVVVPPFVGPDVPPAVKPTDPEKPTVDVNWLLGLISKLIEAIKGVFK